MRPGLLAALAFTVFVVLAPPSRAAAQPAFELVALPHQFAFVTEIASADDGSGRLYIVEKRGTVRVIEADGSLSPAFLIDLREAVGDQGAEQGLLGLAFSPDFETDGQFYVNYTDNAGDTVIERYTSASGIEADPGPPTPILFLDQPASNHNGGHLAFGPDGWLYIGMGDGGGAGDAQNRAQTDGDPLGKMLRYHPATGALETWAKGLRNPWKFSFDSATVDLYIADVGQNAWEEVNFVPAGSPPGLNFGWRVMEGSHCYPAGSDCSTEGLQLPVAEYSHAEGCSVTGGYVVREPNSFLNGTYLFSDYCSGTIWGLRRDSEGRWQRTMLGAAPDNVSTFGEGEDGAIYLATAGFQGSRLYRIAAPADGPAELPFRLFAPSLARDH